MFLSRPLFRLHLFTLVSGNITVGALKNRGKDVCLSMLICNNRKGKNKDVNRIKTTHSSKIEEACSSLVK